MPSWVSYNMLTFILFLALVTGTAFFGGQWGAGVWYHSLSKPSWTPPNWLFPAVWTLLYALIAIAGWLVWNSDHPSRPLLLALWAAQLIFNGLWSYIFFGRRDMRLALVDIIALWVVIAAFIVMAWPVNELAAIAFAPYLLWMSYATALNANIMMRNPAQS
jgi:benzodiazapine receptor